MKNNKYKYKKFKKALAFFYASSYNSQCRSKNADVAQEVEHFLGKEEVSGSSPDISSSFFKAFERQLSKAFLLLKI